MRRNLLVILFFVLLAVLSGYIIYQFSAAGKNNISRIYDGYLACQACAGAPNGMAMDGVDILKHPELHTVNCMKMPACAASGYGIIVKMNDGHYSYFKFDKNGSDLARQDVIAKTAKADHLLVEVTGKLKNGTIVVERIAEK